MFRNLFLVGFKNCGKSTIGELLSCQLGVAYVDLDRRLEEFHGKGKTARELFADLGENGFRDLEGVALRGVCEKDNQVVATGGGVLCRPENGAVMKQSGRVYYLKMDWEGLKGRFIQSGWPAFAQSEEELRRLFLTRSRQYEAVADRVLEIGGLTPNQAAERLQELFHGEQ